MTYTTTKPRRGRPPKSVPDRDTRAELIRSGLEHLTEFGFSASGLDKILKHVGVPKGSFYFYFNSKEAFGHAVLNSYASYFAHKLDSCLLDQQYSPLKRIENFVESAKSGMAKHQFKRGCLVGNLEREVALIPHSFREVLVNILDSWQRRIATCLREAILEGELSKSANTSELAELFWIGWEGAVSRAKLEADSAPLDKYWAGFSKGLPR